MPLNTIRASPEGRNLLVNLFEFVGKGFRWLLMGLGVSFYPKKQAEDLKSPDPRALKTKPSE
jgi:hypothetical protein